MAEEDEFNRCANTNVNAWHVFRFGLSENSQSVVQIQFDSFHFCVVGGLYLKWPSSVGIWCLQYSKVCELCHSTYTIIHLYIQIVVCNAFPTIQKISKRKRSKNNRMKQFHFNANVKSFPR